MFSFLSGPSPVDFPELQTLKDPKADGPAIAETTFKELLAADTFPDWVLLAYDDVGYEGMNDIKLYDRNPPNSVVGYGKAVATVPIAPKALFDKFWAFDLEWAKKFDLDTIEFTKLADVNDDVFVTRVRSAAPFPVTPREFVLLRGRKEENGIYYIYSASVNFAAAGADANYVRGVIPVNGFILRPVEGDPNQTQITRISCVDPKGAIPKWVVDLVKAKAGDYMFRLRKEIKTPSS